MNRFLCGLGVFSVLGLIAAGCTAGDPADENDEDEITNESAVEDLAPGGKGSGTINGPDVSTPEANGKAPLGNGITYHGGPVMTNPITLYYIWYGDWTGNTATTILTDLAGSISGSPRWNTNSTYHNGSGVKVTTSVTFGGSVNDSYSKGKTLTDANIQQVVSASITSGGLPLDVNGVYFVLTSQDVTATSGFCTQYCGWHTHATISGIDIKYSFVGNAARCLSACAAQTTGPNGNAGADAMASIIMHEAEEAATDPDLNAWYDMKGYENADKCAWTFGTTYSSGGALANVHLGNRDYLIQRNWVNASGGSCKMSYP
jgi:Phosphate-induced protein 1 conserved region